MHYVCLFLEGRNSEREEKIFPSYALLLSTFAFEPLALINANK
jgi:hypothetical protein